jgi:SAM-dependent methyltransferase
LGTEGLAVLTVDYDRLDLRPGMTVLDLGCGEGRHAFEAYRRGARVVAVDRGVSEVETTKRWLGAIAEAGEAPTGARYEVVRGDLLALPFPDASVDRVIASEVLEHIPDDGAALSELARVLRPGGTLAVTVPAWLAETVCWKLSDEYHAPAAPGGHMRIYVAPVLRSRLREAGLRPTGSGHAHGLHTPYWWLRCAVGIGRDDHPLVRAYHRLLVWDIVSRPLVTRLADRALNPLLAKSLVLYATRAGAHVAA